MGEMDFPMEVISTNEIGIRWKSTADMQLQMGNVFFALWIRLSRTFGVGLIGDSGLKPVKLECTAGGDSIGERGCRG